MGSLDLNRTGEVRPRHLARSFAATLALVTLAPLAAPASVYWWRDKRARTWQHDGAKLSSVEEVNATWAAVPARVRIAETRKSVQRYTLKGGGEFSAGDFGVNVDLEDSDENTTQVDWSYEPNGNLAACTKITLEVIEQQRSTTKWRQRVCWSVWDGAVEVCDWGSEFCTWFLTGADSTYQCNTLTETTGAQVKTRVEQDADCAKQCPADGGE